MPAAVHLHELPPELLRLILTSFDSLPDLYSLIKASPECFRIYRITPELILSSVLKRAIHPDALHHALAVTHVDPEEFMNPEGDERLWEFLDRYFQRDPTLLEFPKRMDDIVSLAKLKNMVSRLANDYTCRTLHALYESEKTQQDPHHREAPFSCHTACQKGLSATEQARLQRAFYRYELYSRCFPVSHRIPDESIFAADDQFNHFIQQMAPWEVEELSCLHEYFWVRVSRVFSEVEEEVVVKVLDAQTATAASIRAAQLRQAEFRRLLKTNSIEVDDGVCPFRPSDIRGLELFGEDDRSALPDILRYLISLGLPFLRSLLFSQGQRRRDLIRRNYFGEREFLPHAIYEDPNPPQTPNHPENISDNDISHVNLGYLLFRPSSIEAVLSAMGIARYWPLRRLGYVFWDIERVRDPEVNEKLRNARDCDPTVAKKAFHEFIQESAETRLKGMKLPRTLMQEIQNDYTVIFADPIFETDFYSYSEITDSEEDFEEDDE
ncbi:uncharacterized protein Triagg1_819 [Trichoderma aggressivum f. europaeum]|uniref:Uncharacterized protein n=1 Tax=Trichoderma aggressivum f. europaeum TaxID=173218 RepID=A0AAE1IMN3_9HYPO|nr:hypothetical protein Triagg1_819 [Trichoderma aggressivum f. europaeum]